MIMIILFAWCCLRFTGKEVPTVSLTVYQTARYATAAMNAPVVVRLFITQHMMQILVAMIQPILVLIETSAL